MKMARCARPKTGLLGKIWFTEENMMNEMNNIGKPDMEIVDRVISDANAAKTANSGRGYVERTQDEFNELLVNRLNFHIERLDGCGEVVYQRVSKDGEYIVRVYSSIQIGTGRTRPCGDDAIRVVMINGKTGRPMKLMNEGKGKAGKRINRTKGTMKHLEHRVKQYLRLGSPFYRCPECGSVMALRKNKTTGDRWLGCTNLIRPEENVWCKGSRSLPAWIG